MAASREVEECPCCAGSLQWPDNGDSEHYDACEGCFIKERGLSPWEIVRLHDPDHQPPRERSHHVVILPEYDPERASKEMPRKIPCLWITSHPRKGDAQHEKSFYIGPKPRHSQCRDKIQIDQIGLRRGEELILHARHWKMDSWLVIRKTPHRHLLKYFHKCAWPDYFRAGLDKPSVDKVAFALARVGIQVNRFSPFVSLDNASLASALRRPIMLTREKVLEWDPTLEAALNRERTGLSLPVRRQRGNRRGVATTDQNTQDRAEAEVMEATETAHSHTSSEQIRRSLSQATRPLRRILQAATTRF